MSGQMDDINDHIHGEPVVFCKNRECPEPPPNYIRLPITNPPRTNERQETTPLDNRKINYICRTCHHLSVFGKDDVHWLHTLDKVQDLAAPHTALWRIRYRCGVQSCGEPVEVFVSAESNYSNDDVLSFWFQATQFPVCAMGHADINDAEIVSVGIALTL